MSRHFEVAPEQLFPAAEASREEPLFPPIVAGLVGGACADALGWVTEFMRSPASIPKLLGVERVSDYVAWRKKVGGRFNTYIDYVAPGEYSDDTQLTLSVARSLRSDGSVDQAYFGKRELPAWLDYSRGAGRTITAAAKKIARQRVSWNTNFFTDGTVSYRASGANGAAMRVSPIALANLPQTEPPLEETFANAIVTHGHPRAHLASLLYVTAIHEAARRQREGADLEGFLESVWSNIGDWHPQRAKSREILEWLNLWNREGDSYERRYGETLDEIGELLKPRSAQDTRTLFDQLGCFGQTKGSGTVTVAAALHLFVRVEQDVERGVTEAVNAVPADTDTIGAFVGTLTGVYGGYDRIPDSWTAQLQDLGYLVAVAEELARIASRTTEAPNPLRPRILPAERQLPEIMELLRSDRLNPGDRVRHELLGAGWVEAIHAQEIRRRGGGQIAYGRIAFDIGQHCQFRARISQSGGRATQLKLSNHR